jgi:enoyl-CoA hydratase/carnithine racemase
MIDLLVEYLEEASTNATIRAIVVTGNPDGRAFCAGADLSPGTGLNKSSGPRKVPPVAEFRDGGGYSSLAALQCTKPIIAAINGASVGWGMAVTLAMDIRVVSEDAKVGFTMAARGLLNESCSSWLLPRLVGAGIAKELVFTGRVMKAKDAPAGLFNHVVPKDQVLPKALEIAREIADNCSGMSVATCKFLMDEGGYICM